MIEIYFEMIFFIFKKKFNIFCEFYYKNGNFVEFVDIFEICCCIFFL